MSILFLDVCASQSVKKELILVQEKEILGSKQLLLKHHISAQNEGKQVLATVLPFFKISWGGAAGMPPDPPSGVTPAAPQTTPTLSDLTLCQQINLRALHLCNMIGKTSQLF